MARAPRPGAARKKGSARFSITVDDRTHILHQGDLGPEDYRVVRKQTGMAWKEFFGEDGDKFDYDSLEVLWWMARRKDGEPRLSIAQVDRQWPTADEFAEMVADDRIVLDVLDDDVEEDPDDPLPSEEG
jgi:hypothetical protein